MRTKSPQKFKRLTTTLPIGSLEALGRLRTKLEASSDSEVIRRAVRLYELLLEHSDSGGEITVRDKSGREKQIFVDI